MELVPGDPAATADTMLLVWRDEHDGMVWNTVRRDRRGYGQLLVCAAVGQAG